MEKWEDGIMSWALKGLARYVGTFSLLLINSSGGSVKAAKWLPLCARVCVIEQASRVNLSPERQLSSRESM